MSRRIKQAVVLALSVLSFVTGCQSLADRPARVQARLVEHDAPLRRLAATKRDGDGNLVVILTDKNTNLSKEAAPITPLLSRAFGTLQPSGVTFYAGRNFAPGGYVERGDPDFNIRPTVEQAVALAQQHRNADGTPAEVILLDASAHMDDDISRVRKNTTIRALAETRGGYVEGNLDFQVEESVSELTFTLSTRAPTAEALPTSVQLKANLYKQSRGSQYGIFIFGSGSKHSKDVTITQGLSEALEVCVNHAVLELCSQLLSVDAARFQSGDVPAAKRPARRTSPSYVAASLSSHGPAPTAAGNPPSGPGSILTTGDAATRPAVTAAPVEPRREAIEFALDYQIRTAAGHVVDTEPAVMTRGDRFYLRVAASADCHLYVFSRTASGHSLISPVRSGHTSAIRRGTEISVPAAGGFALQDDAGVDSITLVASSKPIDLFESVARGELRANAAAISDAVQRILRETDRSVVSRTKLPKMVRLTWGISANQPIVAARLVLERR